MEDQTQYLPKHEPRVNAFRSQHYGLHWDGNVIKNFTWLPDLLLAREYITQDHLSTCMSVNRALQAMKNALGISKSAYSAKSDGDGEAKNIFTAIITQMNKRNSNLCLWVSHNDYNKMNYEHAIDNIGYIKSSLELAQKVIDDL